MKKKYIFIAFLIGTLYSYAQESGYTGIPSKILQKSSSVAGTQKADRSVFIENKGQWQNDVLFYAKLNGTNVWITRTGIVYDFYQKEKISKVANDITSIQNELDSKADNYNITGHVVKMNFTGIINKAEITGKNKQDAYYNYFIGNEPDKWASNVSLFNEVIIKNMYEKIDVRLYFDQGQLRYDLIAAPYANLQQIQLSFDGQEKISTDNNCELQLKTCLGNVKHAQIYAWQEMNGIENKVDCKFSLQGSTASFSLKNYDPSKPLIIDPLVYSTFLGGSGSDGAYQLLKTDNSGFVYVCAETQSTNFPTSTGAYQTTNNSAAVFVTKLYADLSQIVYSTFIGGNASYEYPDDIEIDQFGNMYITGVTDASDFPTTSGVLNENKIGNYDGFVTKLNSTGSALLFSTYIGGIDEDWGNSLVIDSYGAIYLAGTTKSSSFPTTTGAYLKNKPNSYPNGCAFSCKINSNCTSLIYSTFLGGSGRSNGNAIAVDISGQVYISGGAKEGFPCTADAFDPTWNGNWDTYLAILDNSGTSLVYSTYIGGSNDDEPYLNNLALDVIGNIYIVGNTNSNNFPTYLGLQSYGGLTDSYILKLNSINAGSPSPIYSTYLGGSNDEYTGNSLDVDVSGKVFFTGYTFSTNFPTTLGAYQTSKTGNADIFITKINSTGSGLLYSSYLGGSSYESVPSGVAVGDYYAYVAGSTSSSDFPITTGAYDETYNGGGSDIFISKIDLRSVVTGSVPQLSICTGNTIEVPFIASLPFDIGNVFTAQLSDASGNFTAAVNIGSLSSMTSGTINALIPAATPYGTGYRIRVIGSNPFVYGTDNGVNITINLTPNTSPLYHD